MAIQFLSATNIDGSVTAKISADSNSTYTGIVISENGLLKYRTKAQILSDIGATNNVGTVTSITVQGTTGLSGSGTITTNGTITLTNIDRGSSQFIYKNIAADSGGTAVANTNNDTITFAGSGAVKTSRSGDVITITSTNSSNNFVSSASFATATGVLTLNRSGLSAVTVDLDGRYVTSSGVTSVATGNGISGGIITTTGTLTVGAGNGLSQSTTGLLMSGSYTGNYSIKGGLTTEATININNPASDKKISFDRTGGKAMSIEHDASSMYFYNETDAVTMFKMFNAGSATVTGDFTVNGGDIVLGGTGRIQGVDTVSSNTDAANKLYVDNAVKVKSITPNAPASLKLSIVGETIEVLFDASTTAGIDYYQVWSSDDGGDFGIIGQIPITDIAATMTVVDTTFNTGGNMAYRVYAVRDGVYSAPKTANINYTVAALNVSSLSVINFNTAYYVQYEKPSSRFIDHIEIYMDSQTTQAALSRSNAGIVYSGQNAAYMQNVAKSRNFHQFWVEVVTS